MDPQETLERRETEGFQETRVSLGPKEKRVQLVLRVPLVLQDPLVCLGRLETKDLKETRVLLVSRETMDQRAPQDLQAPQQQEWPPSLSRVVDAGLTPLWTEPLWRKTRPTP